ncbi:TetR/AcrR family transcriptional regulator [Streptomyces sp. NBC_01283]|uniref:TetR/AcrR family transcriptional regulator n=1 Tax=Streptomyces sp. NBC_01283 TaxID=2903812 RepID=UPI00352F8DA3|nr:TetR/AcrR family transcriptional regulator [Streptomyces sp. NBC_01283]
MTTNDRPQATRGGGPRRKQQIFDATLKALARDGFESMTIEGIAEESGVNKTTIYRWWPSKSALVGAALIDAPLMDLPMADTGHLRGDLEHLVDGLVRLLTTQPSGAVARSVLGAAVGDPGLATYIQGFFADRLTREQSLIDRAVARGELPPGTDTMLLMDLLAGAVWLRVVFRRRPLDDDFARRTVAAVLDGVRTP